MDAPRHRRRNSSVTLKAWHFFRDRSPAEIVAAIRRHGALRLAWNAVPGHLLDARFDRRHGVQTSGTVYMHELEVVGGNRDSGSIYDPIPARTCRALLRGLPGTQGHIFVDYGSGKGRVLLIASELPFARVVGVEFAPELHGIATRNAATFLGRRRAPVEPVLGDAAETPVPPGPCVLFFYAPFGDDVMRRVMDRVGRSYAEDPRHMVVVYVTDPRAYPIPAALIEGAGPFTRRPDPRLPLDPARRHRMAAAVWEAAGP